MKYTKLASGLLALTLAVGAVGIAVTGKYSFVNSISASATTLSYGDFEYSVLSDGTVEISGYYGTDSSVEIPSEIDGKTVTSIGSDAFLYCSSLKKITIPESVTNIGESAFYGAALKEVTIPDSVTSIGNSAFSDRVIIYCYPESEAETYANDVGCSYKLLDYTTLTDKVTQEPTCTTEGKTIYTCTCGKKYIDVTPALGHKPVTDKAVAATCTKTGLTEGSHCSVCKEVIKAQETVAKTEHSYGSWSTTKTATCTATGKEERTCAVCGYTETNTIPKIAHKYKTTTVKPTLKAKGYKLHKCSVCGSSYKDTYTAKLVSVSKAKVTIPKASYTYTGKEIKPKVTVKLNGKKLTSGKDYSVTYSSNKKVGTAKIVVKGKGSYTGSVSRTFKIVKKSTKISGSSSFTKYSNVKSFKLNQKSSGGKLSYKSSNTKVVTVDSSGAVTIKGAGKATITVTAAATSTTAKATKKISVKINKYTKATSIKLNKSSADIYYGGSKPASGTGLGSTVKLSATVSPSKHTGKVTYKSSNTKVATVNSDGKVTAVSSGTATITASIDGKKATCKITCHEKPSFTTTCSPDTRVATEVTLFRLDNLGSKSLKIVNSSNNLFADPKYTSFDRYMMLTDEEANTLSSFTISSGCYGYCCFILVDANGNPKATWRDKTSLMYFEFEYDGVKYIGCTGYNLGWTYWKE